ncbi:hypothetical protein ACLOJK_020375 [Asimina triloba]
MGTDLRRRFLLDFRRCREPLRFVSSVEDEQIDADHERRFLLFRLRLQGEEELDFSPALFSSPLPKPKLDGTHDGMGRTRTPHLQ